MSWFQDLAGKAENILNQIDQNAANVLQKTESKTVVGGSNGASKDVCLDIQQEYIADNSKVMTTGMPSPKVSSRNVMSLKRSTSSASMDGSRQTPEIVVQRIASSEQAYPLTSSNSHSRKSSLSSRADLMSLDSKEDDSSTVLKTTLNLGTSRITSELEDALSRLTYMQARANAAEVDLEGVRTELNVAKEKFSQTLIERDAKLMGLTKQEEETRQQLVWSKQEAEQAKNELAQYRSRAQSTLLMKDKIIEQLQQSTSESHQFTLPNPESSNTLALEHLRIEKANLMEENQSLSEQLMSLRDYVDRLESSQKLQQDEFNLKLDEMNRNTFSEETRLRDYESLNKMQIRELLVLREEIVRLQSDHASQLHAKDAELLHLRSIRSSANSSNDLEQRLQSLTQSLVQKQSSLEAVTADRNALRFQLEKIEEEHRQTISQLRQIRPVTINPNDTDDAKARLPMFMQATPFDTNVSRRVKQVYSSLDSVGVRMGVFLRRYPLIRIFTVFYVVLLHLWVMVVLCSSAPNENMSTGKGYK